MKKAELIKYLKRKYYAHKHTGEWEFILKNDKEGYLSLIPNRLGGEKTIFLLGTPSMTLPWLMNLENAIIVPKDGPVPIFFVGSQLQFAPPEGVIKDSHIDGMIAQCFEWFEQQRQPEVIAADLAKHYEIISGFPPAGWQPKHILACVLKGDVDKLQSYLDAFKRGDRMEFIPMIQQEYFERAIPLAEKYRSGELVSPVRF